MREQAFKCKQDLRAQDLNCKILKEKLSTKEVELEQRNDEVAALEHRRDWLEAEVQKLQRLMGEANQKATALDQQVIFIIMMWYTRCRHFDLFIYNYACSSSYTTFRSLTLLYGHLEDLRLRKIV